MNESGFTTVELIVVVSIISLLTAIAMWGMREPLATYKAKGAARQIYGDLQMARLKAVKEGTDWGVEYNGTIYAVKNSGPDGNWDTWNTGDDEMSKIVDLDSDFPGITIPVAPTRNIFSPDGTASGGTVTVTKDSKSQTLCMSTGTGNIRIVAGTSCS